MMSLVLRCMLLMGSAGCAYVTALLVLSRIEMLKPSGAGLTLEQALNDQTMCFVLFAAIGVVVSFACALEVFPVCMALSWVLSRKAPGFMANRRATAHRAACEKDLSALADTVAMGVRAGLSFDASLALYCSKFEGELAEEMSRALAQWQSGVASREQALASLAARIESRDLERFASSVVQAVRFGSPVAETLSAYSRDLRHAQKALLEQRVEKAPVKMLIPLGACILPAMLILVMGPVVLQFMESGA